MATIIGNADKNLTLSVRVRKGNADGTPNPTGMTIEAIRPGQSFEGDAEKSDLTGTTWVHVIKVGGKVTDGWSAAFLLEYKVIEPAPPPATEPAVLPDLPVSIILGDDVTYAKQTINITLKPK